jgi:transglutaminase-like putative cysteine protease
MQTEWILRNVTPKDKVSECLAVYFWFMDPRNFRYTEDIAGVETIKTPEVALETRQGDCDDIACLIAAMLLSVNIPSQFVKVGFVPKQYSHVFVRAFPNGKNRTPVILDPVAGVLTNEMRRTAVKTKFYPILDEVSGPEIEGRSF